MSAHRILHDLYRAPYRVASTTDAESLDIGAKTMQYFAVTTAGAETRTLPVPTKPGLFCAVCLDATGGDLTLTVTSGYNADGDTAIVFGDAGDFVLFYSVEIGAVYRWRVVNQEGTDVAMETGDFDTLSIGGTAITSTAAELNQLDGNILADMATTAGAGITTGADNFASCVEKVGTLFKTTIVIEVDGLNSGANADDIIGKADTANCSLGQITAARNGTIFAGTMTCLEAPTGGDEDIDLFDGDVGTGTEDVDIETAMTTEDILCDSGGDWTIGRVVPLTAFPTADYFLYLTAATGDVNDTYTAGIFVIELWGN